MADAVAELERGRALYADEAWGPAFELLAAADRSNPLGGADLERLATAAYMIGRETDYRASLERAHRAHVDSGAHREAFRCAFWIGVTLARKGEMGQAGGWLARADRLLENQPEECVERGYLLLPEIFRHEASGEWRAAAEMAGEASAIGRRFGDADLFALAAHEQGHILILDGQPRRGLPLLDEAMVAVTARELSPVVSGIVYCGVILACQDAHEVRRAKEWTGALTAWCERQPDLVAFTGRCLVHRAEILQLQGAWDEALEETRRADARCRDAENPDAAGEACYRRGEILRVRGALAEAEEAYREASRHGREPQPGLALLRLAQGDVGAADAAIRRMIDVTSAPAARAALLPAAVEIALAAGGPDRARAISLELDGLVSEGEATEAQRAIAAHARATVELASGRPSEAIAAARDAEAAWQDLDAPYEAARARVVAGAACRELGDLDTAALELDHARAVFAELGAATDLARLDALTATDGSADSHGLTAREREVLRHVAAGATNKAIAEELVLSARTIDRHVSNIFAKLGVSSRAAAAAYAHEHKLL